MPDWRRLVRTHLPPLALAAERENEIIDELAQLLSEYAEEHGMDPGDEAAVHAWLASQVPEWRELVREIDRLEHPLIGRLPSSAHPSHRPTLHAIGGIMDQLRHQLRDAFRSLTRNRVFALVALTTLAVGIGLNATVFSIVNAVLLKPLPVSEPDRLASVYTFAPDDGMRHQPLDYPTFQALEEQRSDGLVERLAAFIPSPVVLETEGESQLVVVELVSGSYFETLGLQAALGRCIAPSDDLPGRPSAIAVLSHGAWQRRFAADPEVVGRELRLSGNVYTVVGVAPAGFSGLTRGFEPELWLPLESAVSLGSGPLIQAGDRTPGVNRLQDRRLRWLWVVARLAEGVSSEQAKASVQAVAARLGDEFPEIYQERSLTLLATDEVRVIPDLDTALAPTSWVLMALVGLVLLIACGNIANMMLARALERRGEIATRLALGAGRAAVIRQLLVESLVLSLVGGGLGLLLALVGCRVVSRLSLPLMIQPHLDLSADHRVLAFTLAAATLTALVFGLAPALIATRLDLSTALVNRSRGSSGGLLWRRLRSGLVVIQVALCMLLLVFAGLSLRSMLKAHTIDPGFNPAGVVSARFVPGLQGYDSQRTRQLLTDLRDSLGALPGISSVGFIRHIPLTFEINIENVAAEGKDSGPPEQWPTIDASTVDPGFFATLQVQVVEGRAFDEGDTPDAPLVAVVNQAMAASLWPGEHAIGKRLRVSGEQGSYEVVGVVRDGKYRTLGEAPRPFLYRNMNQIVPSGFCLLARHSGGPEQALAAIRNAVRAIDPSIAIHGLAPFEQTIASSLLMPRVGMVLFGLFGGIGLLLATVGISGVIAHAVSQRTREIGIRVAMGAVPMQILGLTLREGVVLASVGTVIGLAAAAAASRVISVVLYGISALDPLTFVVVPMLLIALALLASYLPARRALRIDPVEALRWE